MCNTMRPSIRSGWVVDVQNVVSLILLIPFFISSSFIVERIWFTLTTVSSRQVAVCITVGVGPYCIQSLYVVFAVSAVSLTREKNLSGTANETAHLRRFSVFWLLLWYLKWEEIRSNTFCRSRKVFHRPNFFDISYHGHWLYCCRRSWCFADAR